MFLQAAGMSSKIVRHLTDQEGETRLSMRQRVFMAFARKLTSTPRRFDYQDAELLRKVLPDEGDVIEAANVVAGFNFANRVADALDVPCEVPSVFRRQKRIKHFLMSLM